MINQTNGTHHTGIDAVMDFIKNMPLPDSHRNWNRTLLLQIQGQVEFCYEWMIRDGQWQITEGQTREPDLILRGTESDFVKEFTEILAAGKVHVQMVPSGDKKTLSIQDSLKYGTLRGKILNYVKEQRPQLAAEVIQQLQAPKPARQLAPAGENLPPAPQKDEIHEILPHLALPESTCANCGKTYAGFVRNPPELMPMITGMLAARCKNCGYELCKACQDKLLKISIWDGWKKTTCPKCGELFGPGKIITTAVEPLHYVPIFFAKDKVLVDPDSGVVRHQASYQASILDGITASLIYNRGINNATAYGIGKNKYAYDHNKLIAWDAEDIGKAFFASLVGQGAIMNSDEMHIWYQGSRSPKVADDPVSFGKIITLYAQDIAAMQGRPVTLETMASAYQFFLIDFQRYLTGIGVKFDHSEELLDWRICFRKDDHEKTTYLLVTSQRVLEIEGKVEFGGLQLFEGESQALVIFRRETNPHTLVSETMFVFRTNQRLIWYTEKSFRGVTFTAGDLDQQAVIKNVAYFDQSRLLLVLTDQQLLVWPEKQTLQTIALAAITRIEPSTEAVVKKTLFISHKAQQHKIVLHCPDQQVIDIAAKDQEAIMKFLHP